MADRTSASLFGRIFNLLAVNPTEENKHIARQIWPLRKEYDFNDYQMYCDDELIKLGLAKEGVHPEFPEEGATIIYEE
jgi:hypothetical protein